MSKMKKDTTQPKPTKPVGRPKKEAQIPKWLESVFNVALSAVLTALLKWLSERFPHLQNELDNPDLLKEFNKDYLAKSQTIQQQNQNA